MGIKQCYRQSRHQPYGSAYPEPIGHDGKLVAGAKPLWNDSWDDALSQDAHYTDLNVRVSGGSKTSKYFVSAGYMDDQGAYICSGFKRYTLRANVTSDIRKWLQIGLNVSGTHSVQDYPKQDDSTISNVVMFARSLPSFYPVYQRDLATGAYLLDEMVTVCSIMVSIVLTRMQNIICWLPCHTIKAR